ncbi:hypothetical protein Tco_0409362 [Tanacetum coccineum]
MLHPRYRLMDDLMKYRVYPEHLRLRMETVKPIIDDVMVVDWIFNCASVSPNPGSAMRVAFLKLKLYFNSNAIKKHALNKRGYTCILQLENSTLKREASNMFSSIATVSYI